jgi:hypothetical protein
MMLIERHRILKERRAFSHKPMSAATPAKRQRPGQCIPRKEVKTFAEWAKLMKSD